MSAINCQFIVYACPTGELNNQLEEYFNQSRKLYGKNAAHEYMPHCTLTGFFTEKITSIPIYTQALDRAYIAATNKNLSLDIKVEQLTFNENWHGLELQANGLKRLICNFSAMENSSTRKNDLRLKDWLHLSLAYNFEPKYAKELKELAKVTIDINAEVNWELRFYQKNLDWTWKCWKSWKLTIDN